MAGSFGTSRPALGQIAGLGTFYDARTDSFLPTNLVAGNPSPSILHSTSHKTRQVKAITNDTMTSKFSLFGLSNELGASVLAGMVPVTGSASYLKSCRLTNTVIEGALRVTITTEHVKLDIGCPSFRRHISVDAFQSGNATHVVVGLIYGAQLVVGVRCPSNPGEDCRAFLKSKLSELGAYCEKDDIGGIRVKREDIGVSQGNLDHPSSLKFAVFSDIPGHGASQNIDITAVHHVVGEIPSMISKTNGGLGVAIEYKICPLDYLRFTLGTGNGPTSSSLQPSDILMGSYLHLYEQWKDVERHIKDYDDERQSCRGCSFCQKDVYDDGIIDLLEKALQAKLSIQTEFSRILKHTRSSAHPTDELKQLVQDSYKCELSPKATAKLVAQARARLHLRKLVLAFGGQYTDYNRARHAVSVGSNIYVFYFTEETRRDEESWDANRQIIERLLRRNPGDYLVAVSECTNRDIALTKSKITFYRQGRVKIADLRESMDLVDQSFARFNSELLDATKCTLPPGRKLVRIPCPNSSCDKKKLCEWTCYECRMPFEYCDGYVYCECGRVKAGELSWQCSDPGHGEKFRKYHASSLATNLRSLGSYKDVNILILGETGVGKSTFINAFYNYMQFSSLDEALGHDELRYLIPSSFSMQYIDRSRSTPGNFIQCDVKVGKDDVEHDGSSGDSATQYAGSYRIAFGDTIVRLIDTPGVGDVRGIEADQKNLANILGTISRYDHLHGIIILLKPNSSRLSLMFRFCVKELLTNLHKDAAKNIIWGFTSTRQSNYMPGDSYKPLERLVSGHRSLGLELSPETVFCFDSESFRYLAAAKQAGVKMDNTEDFRRSWVRSVENTTRLMKRVQSQEPHPVRSTVSLNRARELISQLTQPLAALTDTMERTIRMNQDKINDLQNTRLQGDALRNTLHFDRIDIKTERLGRPRTVCKHPDCVDLKDVAGVKRPLYKSHCHPACYLKKVDEDVVGHAEISRCSAFVGQNHCHECGHHWQEHMHIRYSQTEMLVRAIDPAVRDKIRTNASEIQLKETATQSLEKQVQETKNELGKIRDAAVKFGYFLKSNSITAYNDAMIAYIDMMIREERQTVAHAASNNVDAAKNEERLKSLECSRSQYAARIDVIESQMSSSDSQVLDEQDIEDLIQEICQLPSWGKTVRDLRDMEEWSHALSYREHEIRPKSYKAAQGWFNAGFTVAKNAVAAIGHALGHHQHSGRGKRAAAEETRPGGYDTRQKRRQTIDLTGI